MFISKYEHLHFFTSFDSVSLVADACQMIIEDDSIHGKAVRVTPGSGIDFHEYPSRAEVSKKFKYTK